MEIIYTPPLREPKKTKSYPYIGIHKHYKSAVLFLSEGFGINISSEHSPVRENRNENEYEIAGKGTAVTFIQD